MFLYQSQLVQFVTEMNLNSGLMIKYYDDDDDDDGYYY